MRRCVPVFGTGLNLQAAAMEGYPHRDDWATLLLKIGERIGMSRADVAKLPRAPLALWERMLCGWATHLKVYPYQAERDLQAMVCELLRQQEVECRTFRLYQTVVSAGFEDIVSLNFDRRIALAARKSTFLVGPNPCPYGSHGESLFRHSCVPQSGGGETRVWYPHGDVKKANTIKLGVRKYGFYLALFREHTEGLARAWRYKPNSLQVARTSSSPAASRAIDSPDSRAPSCFDLFLSRPLVFIGCGLSADEWPLWWLLRQRALSRRAPPVYHLTIGGSPARPPHFRLSPELRVVSFGSPQELWDAVGEWFAS